jgi:hypothetical protein
VGKSSKEYLLSKQKTIPKENHINLFDKMSK